MKYLLMSLPATTYGFYSEAMARDKARAFGLTMSYVSYSTGYDYNAYDTAILDVIKFMMQNHIL